MQAYGRPCSLKWAFESVKWALPEKHNCCSNRCSHRLWKCEYFGWCCFCEVIDTTSYVFWQHLSEPLCSVSPAELAQKGRFCTGVGHTWETLRLHTPPQGFILACATWNEVTLLSLGDYRKHILLHPKNRFPESKPSTSGKKKSK